MELISNPAMQAMHRFTVLRNTAVKANVLGLLTLGEVRR